MSRKSHNSHGGEMESPDLGLSEIAHSLMEKGLNEEASLFHGLSVQVQESRRPPGLFSKMKASLAEKAQEQWQHVVGELSESRDTWRLIKTRMKGQRLSSEEVSKIKAQLLDIFRVLPAGSLAVANAALPIPGTGLFTPWILAKMGLLPSRWREAHTLKTLEKEYQHLRTLGADKEALAVREIMDLLEEEALHREEVANECALLAHWDANENGQWDEDEKKAYALAVERLIKKRDKHQHQKRWYLQYRFQIFGPVFLTEIKDREPQWPLLVSFDGKGEWVDANDLL